MKAALEAYNTSATPAPKLPLQETDVHNTKHNNHNQQHDTNKSKPGDYDSIKMKYLRSLNIPVANSPIAIPSRDQGKKEENIASSAPIPIPIATSFTKGSSSESESSDTESNSELDLSPATLEPKRKVKKFVPPHELTHTSGNSLINHSLPTNYKERKRNLGI